MGKWYDIKGSAGEVAEVTIFDEIGAWGITADSFYRDLKSIGSDRDLTVRINSPGGSVFDGVAIYNILKSHKGNVDVHVDGLAASMASVIAMAGDRITIPENAFLMIHNPMAGCCFGESSDLRKQADLLDQIAASMAGIYAERSGKSLEEIKEIMDAETWFTGAQAVDAGFADVAAEAVVLSARCDLKQFASIPENISRAFSFSGGTGKVVASLEAFSKSIKSFQWS